MSPEVLAAAAVGATVYLAYKQLQSLIYQGAWSEGPNLDSADALGNPIPRLLPPLPGFDPLPMPTAREELPITPALPQSTAAPVPESVADPVEGFSQGTTDPATVFERRELRRNLEAKRRIERGQVAHHIVPGGRPIDAGRDARRTQQKLKELGIDLNGADNGVALSPEFHGKIHTRKYYIKIQSALLRARTRQDALDRIEEIRVLLKKVGEIYQQTGRAPEWIN